MQILNMSWASRRHNKISGFIGSAFSGFFRQKIVKDEVFFSQGGTRLAHYGNKFLSPCYLVDISEVQDREYFVSDILTELESVEPDILLFLHDQFIGNNQQSMLAGFPDLVVEVWSKGNDKREIALKKQIYSSGTNTEQWYFWQESNVVERYIGGERQKDMNLTEILVTKDGFQVDIRDLALED